MSIHDDETETVYSCPACGHIWLGADPPERFTECAGCSERVIWEAYE